VAATTTNGRGSLDRLREAPLGALAEACGLAAGQGGSWGPCPACAADRRGSSDARGPVNLD